MAKKGSSDAERRVYFYRLHLGVDESGEPLPFDHVAALKHIEGLPFNVAGAYIDNEDGTFTSCHVDRLKSPSRIQLASVRRSMLPQIERQGKRSKLRIQDDEGLFEPTHIVFFPDNIIGAEFNFYGPRPTRLKTYFNEKLPGKPRIDIQMLPDKQTIQRLDGMSEITLFRLRMRASYASVLSNAKRSLGDALEQASDACGAEDIEVIMRPRVRSKGKLSAAVGGIVRFLMKRQDVYENVERLDVRGRKSNTDEVQQIDMLNDRLNTIKHVARAAVKYRAVSSDSMYEAIEAAYSELHDKIVEASGIAT